ncbi:NAD(P)/FAD-dependent oxidoreductase [Hamadaea tsunoensis]|uniref:NAD(P)/FAD-dependent oxidoreductase n=1 Tax=Hamadaea tsunoensis TaxID=53368 RepID=UPI0004882252|nr:NAD(P)/FAD-dependent oxidoreductase [Hamadaea tsunoensis]
MGRPRVVIVGGGFAGFHAARTLSRLARDRVEIVLVNPTDYFLYLPLLPEVAGGVLDPRQVALPLAKTLRRVRLVLGDVDEVDIDGHTVHYVNPEGTRRRVAYDRLILAAGSVNKLLPIPGVAEHAHGFRGLPEALYLRDHMIRQLELADAADDPDERLARCTFVVVGAGYTGTEVAAQGQLLTKALAKQFPDLPEPRWLLVDTADRVLPGLDERLSRTADRVLRRRGLRLLLGTSVAEATADGVRLSTGEFVATRSLIWCVGVRPDPLVESTGLEVRQGRLVVDEFLTVPGHPEIIACGDAAAVPDVTRPGEVTAMTAQHAQRQGVLAARNVAASLGWTGGRAGYRHRDLGFTVDLGGWEAAANPLHIPLGGPLARAVTRGYHLLALPANRVRTAADWAFSAVGLRHTVSLGLVPGGAVPLDTATPELVRTRTS